VQLLRERDIPDEKYTNVFLGYGPEDKNFAVELTYNYGVESYEIGKGFGHFGIASTDIYKICDGIKAVGGKVRDLQMPSVMHASQECRHAQQACMVVV
jgi:lactoylglutathione lyase